MVAVWKKLFDSEDGTNLVDAIATFGGVLYVGASRSGSNKSAFVYRLSQDGCKKWQNVTPPWSSDTEKIGGLLVFLGQLYVGNDQGEIFRTANGVTWDNVTGKLPKGEIGAMHEFKNHLYVATQGTCVYRTSDGSAWTRVDEDLFSGFLNVINSLEEFENHLYVGVGMDNNNGIQLWRTDGSNTGKNWVLFKKVLYLDPDFPFAAGHVHALKTFKLNNELYVGRYHGKGVWYTDGLTKPDGTALHWDYVTVIPAGDVFRLEEHAGKLYLGVSFYFGCSTQVPLLFESADGKNWNVSPDCPYCSATTAMISDLYSYGNQLYVGTGSPYSTGSAEVWELGPPILADAYEPNDNFNDATKVNVGSAFEKAVKFMDLTLHDGDVDFFEIEFESQPEDCFSSFKRELGAGIVVELNPGNLTISVEEEYCNDLFFEVYDADKNHKGTFTNTVVFTCPSQKFNGQTLFVAVPSLASGPVRYNLYVSQNSWWGSLSRPTYEIGEIRKMPVHMARLFEFISNIVTEPLRYFDPNDLIKDAERYLPEFMEHRSAIDKAHLEYGLGSIAHKIGQLNEAERFYRSSLASFKDLGIASSEADVLRNLGELLAAQGKTNEALESLERASQLHTRIEDSLGLSQDRVSLGRYYLTKGEAAKSLDTLEKALHLQMGIPNWSESALNLLSQSEAFMALKKQEAAVACFVLVEDLLLRIENPAMHQEINGRLEFLHTGLAANLGEQKLLALKKSLAGQAETVWLRTLSQIMRK